MAKHESYAPHRGHPDAKIGGNKGVAAKTASPKMGSGDSGGDGELCKAARGLNSGNKKGGLPAQ